MSHETDLLITVPRSCISDFYSKYLNLVETFYCVTLSENKSGFAKERPDYVFFNVIFNLNPADGSYNPRELVGRIQVSDSKLILIVVHFVIKTLKTKIESFRKVYSYPCSFVSF